MLWTVDGARDEQARASERHAGLPSLVSTVLWGTCTPRGLTCLDRALRPGSVRPWGGDWHRREGSVRSPGL